MAEATKTKKLKKTSKAGKTSLTVVFSIISVIYVLPIFVVLLNSFKENTFVKTDTFKFPDAESFVGWANYIKGMTFGNYPFFKSVLYTTVITLLSSALILICCSMAAWFLARVNNTACKVIYYLCVFSMVVPFQMVMFTLSKFANILHLSNPAGICIVYLGFGAGLAVFMFTGFVKQIPLEIEEAAMIDGCSPVQTYFKVVLPIMKPTIITVAILDAMWIWNDYLLPSLVLNVNKYKTIQIAVQFLKQSHGQIDWGAMMAVLVLAIFPIVIFYIFVQRYIIEGVVAGAVKG